MGDKYYYIRNYYNYNNYKMSEQTVDYFINTKLVESYAKTVVNANNERQKLLYLSFQLKSGLKDFKNYALHSAVLDPNKLVNIIKFSGYADIIDGKVGVLDDIEFTNFEFKVRDDVYIDLPYDPENLPDRLYRLIFDVSSLDGNDDRPHFLSLWQNNPLIIHAILNDPALVSPKLTMTIEVSDCDKILNELTDLIDEVSSDLPAEDIMYLKSILNSCGCSTDTIKCEWDNVELETFDLPTFESESILFELSNMDKLICYLKDRITYYKTEVAISSGNSSCYKFVGCLIKSYVSLNKIYRKTLNAHETLLLSARHLRSRYVLLANDHRRGIEAVKGVINSSTDWIKANLDSGFDLSKITCSNRVNVVNGVSVSYRDEYSKYYNSETKRYVGFDE